VTSPCSCKPTSWRYTSWGIRVHVLNEKDMLCARAVSCRLSSMGEFNVGTCRENRPWDNLYPSNLSFEKQFEILYYKNSIDSGILWRNSLKKKNTPTLGQPLKSTSSFKRFLTLICSRVRKSPLIFSKLSTLELIRCLSSELVSSSISLLSYKRTATSRDW